MMRRRWLYVVALLLLVGCSEPRGTYAGQPQCLSRIDGGLDRVHGVKPPIGDIDLELRGFFLRDDQGRVVAETIHYARRAAKDESSAASCMWSLCSENASTRYCERLQGKPGIVRVVEGDRVRIARVGPVGITPYDREVWGAAKLENRLCGDGNEDAGG